MFTRPSISCRCSRSKSRNTPADDFNEPWFEIAFAPADALTGTETRSPRRALSGERKFRESLAAVRGIAVAVALGRRGSLRRALEPPRLARFAVLSQLAWMDEEYLANDPVVRELSEKGKNFTEEDKVAAAGQAARSARRRSARISPAAARGQIEISTTPYYHPILPLLCDTDIARVANPHTPLPHPPFRYPEDAREQLVRARNSTKDSSASRRWDSGPRKARFPTRLSKSRRSSASAGLPPTKECSGARATSASGATPPAIPKTARLVHALEIQTRASGR